jgi:hypothetical protein
LNQKQPFNNLLKKGCTKKQTNQDQIADKITQHLVFIFGPTFSKKVVFGPTFSKKVVFGPTFSKKVVF